MGSNPTSSAILTNLDHMLLVNLSFLENLFAIKSLQASTQNQKIDKITQEVFKGNYYRESLITAGLGILAIGCFSCSFLRYETNHFLTASRWRVIAGIVCLIWFIRNNDPQNLSKAALRAIQSNDEGKAIELIQKGAGQLFPFLPFTWYPPLQMSLLEAAAFHSCLKVCSHLINLGIDFTHTRALNMTDNYETIRHLIEAGVPVNRETCIFPFATPFDWEPLYGFFCKLSEAAEANDKIKLLNSIIIARYLIKQGAIISGFQDCLKMKNVERILVEKIRLIAIHWMS